MSVDDWAYREAERAAYPYHPLVAPLVTATVYDSLLHAFSALLSDEAVEAAAKVLAGDFEPDAGELHETRLMLQAAIDAVTKEARNG